MRILISVLAMLVVGLLATQAKADLVDDLRNGRSDIKAAPPRYGSIGSIRSLCSLFGSSKANSSCQSQSSGFLWCQGNALSSWADKLIKRPSPPIRVTN